MNNILLPELEIYPLVIICDRYTGAYSGGKYTAWNKYLEYIPDEIEADDTTCSYYWNGCKEIVGKGDTPNEALTDLYNKLNEQ